MAFSDWSPTASENALALGINIGENCPAANVNNAMREQMAQLRSAINPVLDPFLASSSLSSARSALGVSGGSTSSNNFGNLTNQANKVPYMTGGEAWATTDLTSFARTLIAAGDAAAARTILGALGVSLSGSASSGTVSFGTFKITWKDATVSANGSTTVTYHSAFSSWSRAWCNGSDFDTSEGDNFPCVTGSSTSGATVKNGRGTSASTTVFAIGV